MSDSKDNASWSRLIRQPACFGALVGAAFYFFVVLGILWTLFGKEGWLLPKEQRDAFFIGRVMSDSISLFTIMAFGAAIALLLDRNRRIQRELTAFSLNLMGNDPDALLLPEDARAYRNELRDLDPPKRELILVRMLDSGLQRARANWSAEDVSSAIQTSAGIIRDETEATYSTTRYLAWAIPSIGFVGTVLGIGQAMASLKFSAGPASDSGSSPLETAASHLSTAFDTTLVALVLSLILMYLLHRVQAEDDRLLARGTDWVLSRLPLRMHTIQETSR